MADWLIEGMRHSDILETIRNEDPTLTDEQFHELLDKAILEIAERSGEEQLTVAFHIEARRELYRKCIAISDYKAAHSILQDIAKIQGIYSQKKRSPYDPLNDPLKF